MKCLNQATRELYSNKKKKENNVQPTLNRLALTRTHSKTCTPAVACTPLDNKRHRNETARSFGKQHQTSNINAAVIILNIPLFSISVGISRKSLNVTQMYTIRSVKHAERLIFQTLRSSGCDALGPAEGDMQQGYPVKAILFAAASRGVSWSVF